LASASVGIGLMMSSGRKGANKRDLRALHEALSLATLAMVALHGLALLGDAFLNPGLAGIAIPFASAYRPLWTGLGIVAGYGLGALGLSYYLRDLIGAARWRRAHRLTAVFWLLSVVHTIGAGSDAGQVWFLAVNGGLVIPAALLLGLRWLGRAEEATSPAGRMFPKRRSAGIPGRSNEMFQARELGTDAVERESYLEEELCPPR
jgi:sulfoxide reductase heme-binding subunit YedZ